MTGVDEPTTGAGTPADGEAAALPAEVVEGSVLRASHRRHRRPGRGRAVQVLYDDAELAAVAAAAARSGLTPSGYVASAALAAAEGGEPPASVAGREALGELMAARTQVRRFAVNVNQAVAALHSGAGVPPWLQAAVEGSTWAVRSVDAAAAAVARRLG